MRLRYLLLLSLGLLLADTHLFAQALTYTPQSPNAASLGRFGEHPVSMFTGIPSISIPIYDISAGPLKLPISLDYHAGGNRVTDMASWVGLGWALKTGGSITRAKIGRPDEGANGILSNPLNLTITNNGTTYPECDQKTLVYTNYISGTNDIGYDIFTFTLPTGKSGQFILKPDSTQSPVSLVTQMVYERLKITYDPMITGSLSFTIVDEDGLTYVFAPMETSQASSEPAGYHTAWYLTEMRGLRPTERIQFTYNLISYQGYGDIIDRIEVITTVVGDCSGSSPQTFSSSTTVSYNVQLLSEIIFPGGKLTFVPGTTSRADAPGAPLLDRIELYGLLNTSTTAYQKIKQFDLQQAYFPIGNSAYNGGRTNGPLSLTSLVIQDANGVEVGRYTAEYNISMPLPGFQSRARDLWGYYNGSGNDNITTLIPPQQYTLYTTTGSSGPYYAGGANRNSSEAYMKACILTKLTYPTCGYSKFFFEANRYQANGQPPGATLAGGLRITRIETRASDSEPIRVKTYKYGAGESGLGDLNVYLSSSAWQTQFTSKEGPGTCDRTKTTFGSYYNGVLTPNDGSPVIYPEVAEYEGSSDGTTITQDANGHTVYTFRTFGDVLFGLGTNTGKTYLASYHWNRGQLRSKTVYPQNNTTTPVYRLVNSWANPVKREVPKIGMMVAQIFAYASSYDRQVVSPCDRLNGYYPPVYYYFPQGNVRLMQTDEYHNGSTIPTSTTTTYNTNYQVQQQRLNATDGTSTVRYFSYPYDFTIPANPTGPVKAIKILQDNNQRNTILEEYGFKYASSSDTDPVLTDGKLTLFQELSGLTNQAYPLAFSQEVDELQVMGGASRKSSFTPLALSGAGSVTKSTLYTMAVTFDSYDTYANPTQFSLRNGLKTKIDWLTLTGASSNLFSAVQQETTNYGTANSLSSQYAYDVPLLGLKSVTDPKGTLTNYAYDSFGRLDAIRDQNSNLVKSFDYNYGCSPYNNKQLALTVPDLAPIMFARPSTVYGTTNVSVVVDVVELKGIPTNGLVTVYVTKDATLSLSMSATATTVGGRPVQNGAWTFDGTSNENFYILTTNRVINASDVLSFGLQGVLTPGFSSGTVSVTAVLVGGSGGETNLNNNSDSDRIDYWQQ